MFRVITEVDSQCLGQDEVPQRMNGEIRALNGPPQNQLKSRGVQGLAPLEILLKKKEKCVIKLP